MKKFYSYTYTIIAICAGVQALSFILAGTMIGLQAGTRAREVAFYGISFLTYTVWAWLAVCLCIQLYMLMRHPHGRADRVWFTLVTALYATFAYVTYVATGLLLVGFS